MRAKSDRPPDPALARRDRLRIISLPGLPVKFRRWAFGFLAAALFPSVSFSQDVTGTFVVNGASTRFSFAYAYWKDQARSSQGC
jgi:hypothetical protein